MISVLAISVATMTTATAGGAAGLARNGLGSYKPMREGASVLAPFSFIRYCVSSPEACPVGDGRTLDWSESTKALVSSVNRQVNRRIRPVNERGDTWSANVASGDCEDFALTKRQALLEAGLPSSALRIAVATTSTGEGHAVLVVKTEAGDFVLDNRIGRVLPWHQTDLRFIKITSAENPRLWRRLL
ncbi:hypothetical protein ASG54_05645 [Aureimonas sp. Leaf460]|nr:hypothetical protein ASG54_05645 [Aureimonas sp. Leaf460]